MIYVSCGYWTPLCRSDEYDYIRGVEISVYAIEDENILLGRFHAERLLLSEAQCDGMSLHEVCDANSGDMEFLYCSLFETRDEEFQSEFELDEITDSVLFVWDSVLHPKLNPYETGLLETVGNLFGNATVLILHRDVTSLPDKDLAHVGFAKIIGTEFIYRHMAVLSPFNKEYPRGIKISLDFTANKDDEAWVMERLTDQGDGQEVGNG